jgi:hypothetical protein
MALANYMYSPVGFGVFGEDWLSKGAALLTGGLDAIIKGMAEPVEISTPEELKGAKLTRGFKLTKRGDQYQIEIGDDLPQVVRDLLAGFTTVPLPDPKKEFSQSIAGGKITLKYIPPASNMMLPLIIGAAVVAIAAIVVLARR